jgi:hypothetical protein
MESLLVPICVDPGKFKDKLCFNVLDISVLSEILKEVPVDIGYLLLVVRACEIPVVHSNIPRSQFAIVDACRDGRVQPKIVLSSCSARCSGRRRIHGADPMYTCPQ